MKALPCSTPIPSSTLTEYWLGELDAARQSQLEEHFFGCGECSSRLSALAQLAEAIKRATREGRMRAILTADFVQRLQHSGMRIREYRLQPGGSVFCTVGPEDDLVVAHLHASLSDVRQLDLAFSDETAGTSWRMQDVAFNPATGEVALASSAAQLRQLSFTTQRVKFLAVDGSSERVIAQYTFNHSPHSPV